MIEYYDLERARFQDTYAASPDEIKSKVDAFISSDKTKINWSVNLKNSLLRNKTISFDARCLTQAMYRPFTRQWYYFNRELNHSVSLTPSIFPDSTFNNQAICVTGLGVTKDFSVVMVNAVPDYQLQANGQCFPLKLYEVQQEVAQNAQPQGKLFEVNATTAPASQPASQLYCAGRHFRRRFAALSNGVSGRIYQQRRPVLLHLRPAALRGLQATLCG